MTKKLNEFQYFEAERFLKDKKLLVMQSEILRNQNQEEIGAKYTVVVYEDNTKYKDETTTNIGDRYTVKIEGKEPITINTPTEVNFINPIGKVWGDFNHNLSLSASDIKFVDEKRKADGAS